MLPCVSTEISDCWSLDTQVFQVWELGICSGTCYTFLGAFPLNIGSSTCSLALSFFRRPQNYRQWPHSPQCSLFQIFCWSVLPTIGSAIAIIAEPPPFSLPMFYYFLYLSFLSVRNAEFLISKLHNLKIDIKESENLYEKYDKCYIKEKQQSSMGLQRNSSSAWMWVRKYFQEEVTLTLPLISN